MNKRRLLELYILATGLLTTVVLVLAGIAALEGDTGAVLPTALLLVIAAALFHQQRVYFALSHEMELSTVMIAAALVLLPLPYAILVNFSALTFSEILLAIRGKGRRQSWRALAPNVGSVVLPATAAGGAYHALHGPHFLWSGSVETLAALPILAVMALIYYFGNNLIIAGAIFLSTNDSFPATFARITRGLLQPEMSLVLTGVTVAVLWHYNPVLAILVVGPLTIGIRAYDAVSRLRGETVEAVLKLAESIDYRDSGTYEHSRRLADLTCRLATALNLTREHVNDIVLASRVHDLGKIGISNEILFKQGPLTMEERQTMEEHPVIGATILSSYSAFAHIVPLVRHHHERWDGCGYPDGLKGEEIPIGSRIIGVVDAFDAMTEDRPYRRGMPVSAAVERIKDSMGAQFDPEICAVFIRILTEEGQYVPPEASIIERAMKSEVS